MRSRLLAALAGLLLVGCGAGEELTIVVISLDTTRPDHLSAYGHQRPTTPHLARLAAEGARFTNARSTSSWTLPAHMSLFTGLPVGLHDVAVDFQVLDRARPTLGEIFHDAGYRTMGVYSAPYVHGRYGFGRGMDFYERGTQDPMVFDLPPERMRLELGGREARSHSEVTSKRVVDRGLALLRGSARDSNLLFLHFFDPHYDYLPPAPLRKAFADPAYRGPVTGAGMTVVAQQPLGEADRAQMKALYDAEIAWVDSQIGRVLAELERSGRLERSLVVVTADHGEEFFERGRFGHRAGLMDEVLRVPLVVWAPGRIAPGTVVDDEVALYDVLPTLLDYAGLPAEPSVWGRSLRPLIEGGTLRPRPVSAALSVFPPEATGHYELHQALVADGMKVIRRVDVAWSPEAERDLGGPIDPSSLRVEVYDLRADPGETRNLYGGDDPRVARLLDALEREDDMQREALSRFRPQGSPQDAADMLELRELMEGVGYLDGGGAAPGPEGR